MPARLEEWLAQAAKAVEIHRDEDGPYATPSTSVESCPWQVWVSNGESNPRNWAGAMVARCSDELYAELVADAIRAYVKKEKS